MELVLVRHAEPVRIEGADGAADPHLTPLGRAQAAACGRWLAAEGLDAVFSSPMRRAMETAQALADACGLSAEIEDGIAEFDRDADTYIPIEELKETDDPRWQALASDRWDEMVGIDRGDFKRTVVDAVDRIVSGNPGRRVAAVCHGGVINIYLADLLSLDRDLWFEPHYASISRVAASRTGIRTLVSLNETGHLRGVTAPG